MTGRLFHIDSRTGHSMAVSSVTTEAAKTRVNTLGRATIVDRSNLKRSFHLSSSTRTAEALDDASIDEFDDLDLDAALASFPSPSPAASVDTIHRSGCFDSHRPATLARNGGINNVDDADPSAGRPTASSVELAISRADLQSSHVLDQVDGKFILCTTTDSVLFCIDQHAADERYRLERLLRDFVSDCVTGTSSHTLSSTLTLGISCVQYDLLSKNDRIRTGMKMLGWDIETVIMIHEKLGHAQVDLKGVPHILRERTLTEKGRPKDLDLLTSVFANCVEEAVSFETSNKEDWMVLSRRMPSTLLDLLKSKACRSAIMFNDSLSRAACQRVVERMAECMFAFQCAHGRPSLVPLCQIKTTYVDDV